MTSKSATTNPIPVSSTPLVKIFQSTTAESLTSNKLELNENPTYSTSQNKISEQIISELGIEILTTRTKTPVSISPDIIRINSLMIRSSTDQIRLRNASGSILLNSTRSIDIESQALNGAYCKALSFTCLNLTLFFFTLMIIIFY